MNKAIIYTRKSRADDGNTLELQRDKLLAYCKLNDLEVVDIIAEHGVSGTKPLHKREGGKQALDMIKNKEATHIVALKLDRLFRNTADALQTTSKWDTDGIALHLVEMGGQSVNTGSSVGRLFITMLSAFATFEADLVAERTSASLQHKKKNGKVYNHLPYGYDRVGNDLVPNAKEQTIIDNIMSKVVQGASHNSIARDLNDSGIAGKTGGKWYNSTINNVVKNHQSLAI